MTREREQPQTSVIVHLTWDSKRERWAVDPSNFDGHQLERYNVPFVDAYDLTLEELAELERARRAPLPIGEELADRMIEALEERAAQDAATA